MPPLHSLKKMLSILWNGDSTPSDWWCLGKDLNLLDSSTTSLILRKSRKSLIYVLNMISLFSWMPIKISTVVSSAEKACQTGQFSTTPTIHSLLPSRISILVAMTKDNHLLKVLAIMILITLANSFPSIDFFDLISFFCFPNKKTNKTILISTLFFNLIFFVDCLKVGFFEYYFTKDVSQQSNNLFTNEEGLADDFAAMWG